MQCSDVLFAGDRQLISSQHREQHDELVFHTLHPTLQTLVIGIMGNSFIIRAFIILSIAVDRSISFLEPAKWSFSVDQKSCHFIQVHTDRH